MFLTLQIDLLHVSYQLWSQWNTTLTRVGLLYKIEELWKGTPLWWSICLLHTPTSQGPLRRWDKFNFQSPGDSGGPLVMKRGSRYVLVGVISWGSPICAQPGHQDVSTHLSCRNLKFCWKLSRCQRISLSLCWILKHPCGHPAVASDVTKTLSWVKSVIERKERKADDPGQGKGTSRPGQLPLAREFLEAACLSILRSLLCVCRAGWQKLCECAIISWTSALNTPQGSRTKFKVSFPPVLASSEALVFMLV